MLFDDVCYVLSKTSQMLWGHIEQSPSQVYSLHLQMNMPTSSLIVPVSLHRLSAFTFPSCIVLVVLREERLHHHLQQKSVRSTNLHVAVYVLGMAEVVGNSRQLIV